MEMAINSGEDSAFCPIWQWPIFQAGPYWKPFPHIHMDYSIVEKIEYNSTLLNCNQTTKCNFQCVHVDIPRCSSDSMLKVNK